jgi:hypothetical protein
MDPAGFRQSAGTPVQQRTERILWSGPCMGRCTYSVISIFYIKNNKNYLFKSYNKKPSKEGFFDAE